MMMIINNDNNCNNYNDDTTNNDNNNHDNNFDDNTHNDKDTTTTAKTSPFLQPTPRCWPALPVPECRAPAWAGRLLTFGSFGSALLASGVSFRHVYIPFGFWLLASGVSFRHVCWSSSTSAGASGRIPSALLASGFWLLASGFWPESALLASGFWLLARILVLHPLRASGFWRVLQTRLLVLFDLPGRKWPPGRRSCGRTDGQKRTGSES